MQARVDGRPLLRTTLNEFAGDEARLRAKALVIENNSIKIMFFT